MRAVVVQKSDMNEIQIELEVIADGSYWHTTGACQTDTGARQVAAMLRYLVQGDDPVVVAPRRGLDENAKTLGKARALCLTKLASTLSAPASQCRTVPLVLEERRNRELKGLAEKTVASARSSGAIPPKSCLPSGLTEL